jgi:hypothetical protein
MNGSCAWTRRNRCPGPQQAGSCPGSPVSRCTGSANPHFAATEGAASPIPQRVSACARAPRPRLFLRFFRQRSLALIGRWVKAVEDRGSAACAQKAEPPGPWGKAARLPALRTVDCGHHTPSQAVVVLNLGPHDLRRDVYEPRAGKSPEPAFGMRREEPTAAATGCHDDIFHWSPGKADPRARHGGPDRYRTIHKPLDALGPTLLP